MGKEKHTDRFMKHHMQNAKSAALMSYSKKRKVGCVVVRENRTIINGWNGTISGSGNDCEEYVYTCSCSKVMVFPALIDNPSVADSRKCQCGAVVIPSTDNDKLIMKAKSTVIHAEENVILYAAKAGIPLDGTILYTTTAPCLRCSRMIVGVGISRIYYLDPFKNEEGVDFALTHGVLVNQLT